MREATLDFALCEAHDETITGNLNRSDRNHMKAACAFRREFAA
jgi:hypothetical protein